MQVTKNTLILIFLTLLVIISACGTDEESGGNSSSCESQMVGTWQHQVTDGLEITFGDDASYTEEGPDGCKGSGTFTCPDKSLNAAEFTLTVETDNEDSEYCSSAGEYSCEFGLFGDELRIYCGGDTVIYNKN